MLYLVPVSCLVHLLTCSPAIGDYSRLALAVCPPYLLPDLRNRLAWQVLFLYLLLLFLVLPALINISCSPPTLTACSRPKSYPARIMISVYASTRRDELGVLPTRHKSMNDRQQVLVTSSKT